ncbi:hypothetical protein MMC26_002179 [Xylographa opegraphella]|nr:hypothetical protein [Xylographa opegraphella]
MVRPETTVSSTGNALGHGLQRKYSLRPSTISKRKRDVEGDRNVEENTNVKKKINVKESMNIEENKNVGNSADCDDSKKVEASTNVERSTDVKQSTTVKETKGNKRNANAKSTAKTKGTAIANAKRSTNTKGYKNAKENTKKHLKPNASVEEVEDWECQYWQGKDDLELEGVGCGWCRFISPFVPSQSPIDGKVRIEVMSGTEGPRDGSIRLCASDDYWPSEPADFQPIFLIPAAHIEQIIVLRNPSPTASNNQAYRIVIVPTAATGASPIIADEHLEGQLGEDAIKGKDTYLSVVERVFDERLAGFGKSVVGVSAVGKEDSILACSTTLSFSRKHEGEESIKEHLYFLDTGLLFLSQTLRIYLSFKSFSDFYLILVRDLAQGSELPKEKNKPAGLEVHVRASEPYYKTEDSSKPSAKENSQDPMLLSFRKMPVDPLDKIRAYAMKQNVKFNECEQLYYDFAKNMMMTGWLPLSKT